VEEIDLFKDWTPEMVGALKFSGKGSRPRSPLSLETKRKISEANMGNLYSLGKSHACSEETKDKISKALRGRSEGLLGGYHGGFLGHSHSKEAKRKISESNMGKSYSEEVRQRISGSLIGHSTSVEAREKISSSNKGRRHSKESRARISEAKMGHTVSEETRIKISEANMGRVGSFLGRSHSEESKRKMSKAHMGHIVSEEHRLRLSKTQSSRWESMTEEERAQQIREIIKRFRVKPTRPEKEMGFYLDSNFPGEWAYNGDYSQGITIGRKIPDFVNINGKKAVVLVHGRYWHPDSDEEEDIKHYAKYGFRCYVVWEEECYMPKRLGEIFKKDLGVLYKNVANKDKEE